MKERERVEKWWGGQLRLTKVGRKGRGKERSDGGLFSSRHWKGGEDDLCDGCKDDVW